MRKEADRLKAENRDHLLRISSLEGQLACKGHDLDTTSQTVEDLQGLLARHGSDQAELEKALRLKERKAEDDQRAIKALQQQLCDCKQQLELMIHENTSNTDKFRVSPYHLVFFMRNM